MVHTEVAAVEIDDTLDTGRQSAKSSCSQYYIYGGLECDIIQIQTPNTT